jgi:alanine racemase
MNKPMTKAVIDLDAVAGNVAALRSITHPAAYLMAVVKADAYGHGSVRISQTALANGADALGVARIEEGRCLREAGISAPILVFGYVPEPNIRDLIDCDITATAFSSETARTMSEAATKLGRTIRIHTKIDTGMGRLGYLPDAERYPGECGDRLNALVDDIVTIAKLPGLNLEGIYTHFATADKSDKRFAVNQFKLFSSLLTRLKETGLEIPLRHAANSGAIIDMPETHLDMVRAGIAIYGLYPSREVDRRLISLIPAMSLKTRIIHLKKVPAHFSISYGRTYETKNPTVIATIPIGYGDGYNRRLSCRGHMLVCGRRAPVVGRVCMDLTMLDVGHIPEVSLNDEVVVFGEQGDASLSVDELADSLDTISYEIVTSVSERIPRCYKNQRSEVGVRRSET